MVYGMMRRGEEMHNLSTALLSRSLVPNSRHDVMGRDRETVL